MRANTQHPKTKHVRIATAGARRSPTPKASAASNRPDVPTQPAAADGTRAWGDPWRYYVGTLQRRRLLVALLGDRGDTLLAHEADENAGSTDYRGQTEENQEG